MIKSIFSIAAVAATSLAGFQSAQAQVTPQPVQKPQVRQSDRGTHMHQGGVTVTEAIAKKMIKGNEAEIEIVKMAQEKTTNDELRQFTQMLVKDHEALNTELQKCCDMKSYETKAKKGQSKQARKEKAQTLESTLTKNETQTDNQKSHQSMDGMHTAMVPNQLCEIAELACDNSLKMTKQMLGKHEGQDFDMAFLRQQCAAHMMMLAELKAIESVGPKEFRELCGATIPKVEQHLETAKRMAKKLADDSESTR